MLCLVKHCLGLSNTPFTSGKHGCLYTGIVSKQMELLCAFRMLMLRAPRCKWRLMSVIMSAASLP